MTNILNRKQQRRRDLLKRFSAFSLLGSGAGAFSGKLGLVGSALANSGGYADISDYKSLVCVFLYGGADSFNMFVPSDADDFANYQTHRGALAIGGEFGSDDVLPAHGSSVYQFNNLLPKLDTLYGQGKVALVSNVGNLIEPVDRSLILNGNPLLPSDLFAHNHQQEQWLKGLSSESSSTVSSGWGGRMADMLQEANAGASLPPGLSISGNNYWLPGQTTFPLSIHPSYGLELLRYLDDTALANNTGRAQLFDQMLSQAQTHPLKQQVQQHLELARDGSRNLRSTLATDFQISTPYNAGSSLASQLRMVARLIAGREALNMRRQIFFVSAGGWDTHDHQSARLSLLLQDLDASLGSFHDTLAELDVLDSVTTFSASDFGRTLTTNGDGSDHGWGGHYFVMGGAVNGGQVFGSVPSYVTGSDDDSGDKGRIIPNLSVNQYGARLGQWMGLSTSDLQEIFPDLTRFGGNSADNSEGTAGGSWDAALSGLFASV